MRLPDFGLALRRSGHQGTIERPFSFKGVGRVDASLYTIEARGEIDGVDHICNIDLDARTWKKLLAALPADQRAVVREAGAAPVGDFVELPFVAAGYFTCEFGEEQEGDGETFLPLVATAVGPVTRIEIG